MQTKKEIIWNNELWNNDKWIIDYETNTIYFEVQIPYFNIIEGTARAGDYHFRIFRDVLYFEAEHNKFYKIVDEQVVESSKEEYDEIKNYRTINKKDPATLRTLSTYVISAIVDDVINQKFNLRISFPTDQPHLINRFSKKFTPEIANQVKILTTAIVAILPTEVDKRKMKQQISDIYREITQKNEEHEDFYKTLIDNIYLNDKDNFDYLSETILNARNSKNKLHK